METSKAGLAIGALSQRTGCHVETIRYYERESLLPAPPRSPGGYRLYQHHHVRRLTFIRRARALGFSLDEVRRLLRLADERRRPCAEARVVAAAHLADVRAKIADLATMERVLARTVARCLAGVGTECPLIEALSREPQPDPGPTDRPPGSTRRRAQPRGFLPGTARERRAPAARASGSREGVR